MRINAFCTNDAVTALNSCDRVNYCGDCTTSDKRVYTYGYIDGHGIYIPDMLDETAFGNACDTILNSGKKAIVRAAFELEETGIIEARYKLSPVMLLHKMGVLGSCTIAGGVCLDNDDLDLMAQEGVALIVTPTASAGYGHGFAPVCAAISRGIRVGVGTFDGKYNRKADLNKEIEFLYLTANAEMRTDNAICRETLDKILAFEA
ncbi:MAG: hypothetical protein J1G04_03640 [Clostridiales bacterium]|nr:hypothetical protein [Clostridiales bacterium]